MTDKSKPNPITMRRTVLRGGAAAAVGILGGPLLGTRMAVAAEGGTIKVGFIRALTGRLASSFAPTAAGALIAFDEVNAAGGILGRKVEPISIDDEASPAKQPGIVLKLRDDGINYAVGPVGSSSALSALPPSQSARIISTTFALGTPFGDGEKYPYHYQCMCNTDDTAIINTRYIVEKLGIKKVGILGDGLEFATQSTAAAVETLKKLGLTAVDIQTAPLTAPDVAPYIDNLHRSGVEAILMYLSSVPQTAMAFNAMAALKWNVPVFGSNVIFRSALVDLLPEAGFKNLYGYNYRTLTWKGNGQPGARQVDFARKLAKYEIAKGAEVAVAHGPFYDFIHILKNVMEDQKSIDVEKVKRGMDNVSGYAGLLGTYSFSPKKHGGLDISALCVATAASVRDSRSMGLFREMAPGQ